jgi:ribosomal protein S6
MVKLITEYANKYNIILKISDKDKWGRNSLLYGIEKNNNGIFKLLIDYAIKNKITIELNEKKRKWK